MARHIRIPLLADLILVDDLAEIRRLEENPRLDRGESEAGPWLNRVLRSRLTKTLRVDGALLPAFRSRDDAERQAVQKSLEDRLGQITVEAVLEDPEIDAIANWVRRPGRGKVKQIGPAVQGVVGRLLVPEYRSDRRSYQAARKINRFLSIDPVRGAIMVLSGSISRAMAVLHRRAEGDPAAIHATAIASHNLVRAVGRMREIVVKAEPLSSVGEAEVLGRCLVSPPTLMRTVKEPLQLPSVRRPVRPGALALYRLGRATEGKADATAVLQRGGWAQCPAHRAVPVVLRAVWRRATEIGQGQ